MRLALITNNASRPPGQVAQHLRELGVEATTDDVVTSSQAAARLEGSKVFAKSLFRQGVLRAKYEAGTLSKELQRVYGAETTLGSDCLLTGLVVVTKRLDTGSP